MTISLQGDYTRKTPRKECIPRWLVPGTDQWNAQVEKNGLAEMQERRAAWFQQQNEFFQPAKIGAKTS